MNAGDEGVRYATLRRLLVQRQAEVREKRRALREDLPADAGVVKDDQELCSDALMRGMDIALLELEAETLRRIDEAIERLDAGTYGACSDCDEAISEARLTALPFASTCRDCQAARENTSHQTAKETP